MSTAELANVTVEGFKTPQLAKHPGNKYYAVIKELHKILTVNAVSIKISLGGCQNRYLILVILPYQYACLEAFPFCLPDQTGKNSSHPSTGAAWGGTSHSPIVYGGAPHLQILHEVLDRKSVV